MFKRIGILGICAGALALAAPAHADFITGSIGFTNVLNGTAKPTGGDSGTQWDGTATGVIFTPATSNATITSETGDFAAAGAVPATFDAFSFSAVPETIWDFISGGLTYQFELMNVISVSQAQSDPSDSAVTLLGNGLLSITGFQNTPGSFNFTANQASDSFTFSATDAAVPVPEPGSMILIGSGLLGLGAIARRRLGIRA